MKFIGLCIRKKYVQFNFTLTGLLQCGHLIPLWVTSDLRQLISKMTLRFCLSGSVSSTPTASAFFFAFFLAHSLVSTSYSSSLYEGVTLDVNMSIFLLKEHGFCQSFLKRGCLSRCRRRSTRCSWRWRWHGHRNTRTWRCCSIGRVWSRRRSRRVRLLAIPITAIANFSLFRLLLSTLSELVKSPELLS